MLLECFAPNFAKLHNNLAGNILTVTEAMVRCGSSNTSSITRALCVMNNESLKANDMRIYRLMKNKNFQLNDSFWRCYVKSIFSLLREQNLIRKNIGEVAVIIDFTSDRDDFLILCASIQAGSITVPIYFSMRNYPKRRDQMDQKKMEQAFVKALRHILPKGYKYRIIADRGFGNNRFIGLCLDSCFDTAIRLQPNMKISCGGKKGLMENVLSEDGVYECTIIPWKMQFRIVRKTEDGSTWFISTNSSKEEAFKVSSIYEQRFKIEKVFQNLKSSGFDIENSKIKKYQNFQRILFLSCFAYSLILLLGRIVDTKIVAFKKNSPISTNLLTACLSLDFSSYDSTQKKLSPL